jgi:shikimate 5-dehydrogenase
MLIHQAAEQLRLLTGREAPLAALIAGFESG